jgi:hypothetical protein
MFQCILWLNPSYTDVDLCRYVNLDTYADEYTNANSKSDHAARSDRDIDTTSHVNASSE